MKNLIITLTLLISVGQFTHAQIIDSLPPYFNQDRILNQTLSPFFDKIVLSGWDEGVAAIKAYIDPNFKPPAKGWMKKEFIQPLSFYLGQAYSSNKQLKLLNEFEQTMFGNLQYSELLGVEYAIWVAKLPKNAPSITKRGSFDPVMHYNPKEISVDKWMPWEIRNAVKADPSSLNRYFGLVLVKQPDGRFLIFPDATKFLPDGTPTRVDTGMADTFKGTDEELQAAQKTAVNFLKAIRTNDRKAFRAAFGDNKYIEEVWTDMRPLSVYRELPEYKSGGLKFERVMSFENQAGWRGQFSTHVAVFRLPEGMKASSLRAPTDFFNPVVFPAMDGSSKEPAYVAEPGKGGFTRVTDDYSDSIFLGPLIGSILGDHGQLEKYITVVLKRQPGTNNFNIGMPPTVK